MTRNVETEQPIVSALETYFEEFQEDEFSRLFPEHFGYRSRSVPLDWKELKHHHDEDIAEIFAERPEYFLAHAEEAYENYAHRVLSRKDADLEDREITVSDGTVRVENYRLREIRRLRANQLNTPVNLSGVVSKRTDVNPKLSEAKFICDYCQSPQQGTIKQGDGEVTEPNECDMESCNSSSFSILYDSPETEFIDTQTVKLRERPESLKGGERPQEINVKLVGDICGEVTAGDRVDITGILRPKEQDGKTTDTTHDKYLEGLGITYENTDSEEVTLTEREEEEIEQMVEDFDRDPLEIIRESIAPSIYGYHYQKRAIALQLFGGVRKTLPDESQIRGDIHILLIGDPGTGKSKILEYVNEIAPRSVYSSGKGSSAAGLTAAAVQDDFGDQSEWTLEAGALVLADKGIAAIDELDKMDEGDRSAMHQALEQQEISVAKAGINATLQSRCSLLAAANPKYGRFDIHQPITNQLNLEPALISRFDLIFTVKDKPDEEEDAALADHILDSNQIGELNAKTEQSDYIPERDTIDRVSVEPELKADTLRQYIAYAKNEYTPELTTEAREVITDFYTDLREEDGDSDDENGPISITARKLEAAVRLAEASARIRLNERIKEDDADDAVKIIGHTMRDVGYDPDTGEFDADLAVSDTSHNERQNINSVLEAVKKHDPHCESDFDGGQTDVEEGAPLEAILDEMNNKSKSEVRKVLNRLRESGEIYTPSSDSGEVYKML